MLKNLKREKIKISKVSKNKENNLFDKMKYSKKGITLIALVITIIVLLFLAGISIATLTGDNGILTQANKAKTETEKSGAQENIELEVTRSYGKTGEIDLNLLNNNLKNNVKGLTYNGVAISDTNKITRLPAIVEVDGYKIQISGNGTLKDLTEAKNVAEITDYVTTDTLVIDDYKNYLIVPEDFKIRIDDTTNNANTVNEGIVVEDRSGNQFVWVPVGDVKTDSTGTTVNIELKRYVFNSDGTVNEELTKLNPDDQLKTSSSDSYYYTEVLKDATTSNAHAKDIEAFVNSANNNHGYYIGRYEAGVTNYDEVNIVTSNDNSETNWTGYNKVDGGEDLKLVCKTGQQVWNYVTQNKASELARNMYTGKKYESDLINSYAWDTTIVFIQKFGVKTNSLNYSRQIGESVRGGLLKTGTRKLSSTNTLDEQCNIYDMAGSGFEFTTETCSDSRFPCVRRGGHYYDNTGYSGWRCFEQLKETYKSITFRPLLYVNV